jgi:predicted dehydrogenase
MRFFLGDARSVSAVTKTAVHNIEAEDTAVAVVEYASGPVGIIESMTSVKPGYPRRFELCGEQGCVVMEENEIVRWDLPSPAPELDCSHEAMGSAGDPSAITWEGHRRQIEDMLHALDTGFPVFYGAKEARGTVALICAIYESARTGRRIEL